MRNFFGTFFSVKRLAQKIDRFVDYFHCPLEDEVDNWWEKNLDILKHVHLIVLFIHYQIYPFRTQTKALTYFVLWSGPTLAFWTWGSEKKIFVLVCWVSQDTVKSPIKVFKITGATTIPLTWALIMIALKFGD